MSDSHVVGQILFAAYHPTVPKHTLTEQKAGDLLKGLRKGMFLVFVTMVSTWMALGHGNYVLGGPAKSTRWTPIILNKFAK